MKDEADLVASHWGSLVNVSETFWTSGANEELRFARAIARNLLVFCQPIGNIEWSLSVISR